MKISRGLLSVILLSAIVMASIFGGIQSNNGSVNSSPQSILLCFSLALFAIFSPRKNCIDDPSVPVGLGRRLAAFYIDMVVICSLMLSLGIIPILVFEYVATGVWQWSYIREGWEARDVLSVFIIFSMFFGIFYYLKKHACLKKATPGQFIMGYRIIPSGTGNPDYNGRTLYGTIAMGLSIITWLNAMNIKDGIYWWDQKSHTRAITAT